jgi:MSHA pilin protein MshC
MSSHRKPGAEFQLGFTMVELITVMVIAGVLTAVAIQLFFDNSAFQSRGFYDQVISTLRYAQKAAIAQNRFVCISFPANNSVTLTYGTDNTCASGALASPSGTPFPLTSTNASFANPQPTAFSFDALGRPNPNAQQTININNVTNVITVEAETGYVH